MSAFEFYFSFYGLILGLSVVEIVTGLVRTFKQRQHVRIGWLTPMLGLVVLMDLVSFWSITWFVLPEVEISYRLLIFGLLIATIYFAAASMVTPDNLQDWPDFDAFYEKNKAYVISGVMLANVIAFELMGFLFYNELWLSQIVQPMYWAARGPFFAILIALILFRSRRVNIALLGVMIALYCLQAIVG